MPARAMRENRAISLTSLPVTAQQRRSVLAAAAALLALFGVVAPFAALQLPQFNAFTPTLEVVLRQSYRSAWSHWRYCGAARARCSTTGS
jgi:hypothetical protein